MAETCAQKKIMEKQHEWYQVVERPVEIGRRFFLPGDIVPAEMVSAELYAQLYEFLRPVGVAALGK